MKTIISILVFGLIFNPTKIIAQKKPKLSVTVEKAPSTPQTIADIFVCMESFSLIEIHGQNIKSIALLDSTSLSVKEISQNILAITPNSSFKTPKEALIVAQDTIVKIKIGYSIENKTDKFLLKLKPLKKMEIPKNDSLKVTKLKPLIDSDVCTHIYTNNTYLRFGIENSEHSINVRINRAIIDDTKMYFEVRIQNNTNIPYTISKILFSLISKPKKGSTSSTIIPVNYCENNPTIVKAKSWGYFILSIPITPLREDEVLEIRSIENSEIAHGRNVPVEIKPKMLNEKVEKIKLKKI